MQIPPGRRGNHTRPPRAPRGPPPAPTCAGPPPVPAPPERPGSASGRRARRPPGETRRRAGFQPPPGTEFQLQKVPAAPPLREARPRRGCLPPGSRIIYVSVLGPRRAGAAPREGQPVAPRRCVEPRGGPGSPRPPAAPPSLPAERGLASRGALVPARRKPGFIFPHVESLSLHNRECWAGRGNEAMGGFCFLLPAFLCTERSNFRISSAAPSPEVGSKLRGSLGLSFSKGRRGERAPSLANSAPCQRGQAGGLCGLSPPSSRSRRPARSPTFRSVPGARVFASWYFYLNSRPGAPSATRI